MEQKRILVTGAKGQLGSSLKELTAYYPDYHFFYTDADDLDITNAGAVNDFVLSKAIDTVINCAAYTAVDKAESESELAYEINAEAVKNLTDAVNKSDAELIHFSTDYVFDNTLQVVPYKESDVVNPLSVYGKSKLAGEAEASKAKKHIIIRTSWLYSPFGHNFLKTMLRLGKDREELTVVFDQIGTPTYAPHLAEAVLKIIARQKRWDEQTSGLYHYSDEGVCSWYDFANEIMVFSDLNCKVLPVESKDFPTPAKRPHFSVLNKSKIKEAFNLDIPHWRSGMIECLNRLN